MKTHFKHAIYLYLLDVWQLIIYKECVCTQVSAYKMQMELLCAFENTKQDKDDVFIYVIGKLPTWNELL